MNVIRRAKLVVRGMIVFKDWDIWLADRFHKKLRAGLGVFRLRNGVTFAIDYDRSDAGLFGEVWLRDFYEAYYRIRPGDVVIDIGAHIGVFAVLAATRDATVYAYEPTPSTFAILEKNAAPYPNLHAFHTAVSDAPGAVTLIEMGGRGSSGNTIVAGSRASAARAAGDRGGIPVPATTLAAVFSENHLDHCDLLKLDCEGAEVGILKAAPPELFKKLRHIAMEYHGNLSEVRAILESKGCRIIETRGGDLGYLWAEGAAA